MQLIMMFIPMLLRMYRIARKVGMELKLAVNTAKIKSFKIYLELHQTIVYHQSLIHF